MSGMEERDLHQKAMYWAASGEFDNYGEPKISSSPIEINVRWEYKQTEVIDAQGNTRTVNAIAVVDRVVPLGSVFWLGTQRAYNALTNPTRYYVFSYKSIPDVMNRATRKSVQLMKLGTELPSTS